MDRYTLGEKLGAGTYATVYKATDALTTATVAIKRIKSAADGALDISAIRELQALKSLPPHENILALRDVYVSQGKVPGEQDLCLVLDYHGYDLEMLIKDRRLFFTEGDIKAWMLMILRSIEHLHMHGFIHRVRPRCHQLGSLFV